MADGSGIFYVTERGEAGLLLQESGPVNNRVVFQEVAVRPVLPSAQASFKKIWSLELAGTSEHKSAIFPWKGQDGVEYCLVWDGVESLFCINDLGEEIWQTRMNNVEILDLAASSEADLAVVISKSGVIGYDLSGCEIFKFFGHFRKIHVFAEGAMILLDNQGKCRFYFSPDHFSHFIEAPGLVVDVIGMPQNALLRLEKTLLSVDSEGRPVHRFESAGRITFVGFTGSQDAVTVGDENGRITILDADLQEIFAYNLDGSIRLVEYNRELETVFVANDSEKIQILRRRTGEKMLNSLTGRPAFITHHESGAIVATEFDQLGLINSEGQIMARYTSPYKLKAIFPCHRKMSMIVLADEALICLATVNGNT
jgi:hypothetical protein